MNGLVGYYIFSVDRETPEFWDVAKANGVWSPKVFNSAAKEVKAGDRFLVYKAPVGFIAHGRFLGEFKRLAPSEVDPWTHSRTFEYLAPIEIIDEYQVPAKYSFTQNKNEELGINTFAIRNFSRFREDKFALVVERLQGLNGLTEVPRSALEIAASELLDQEEGAFDPQSQEDARRKVLQAITRRQGQPKFRSELLKAYQRRCAITGCDVEFALEAAHITPYLGPLTNTVTNGLLLRCDIHTLFDLSMIAIDTNTMTVLIHPSLHGTSYRDLAGRLLHLPVMTVSRPSLSALDAHRARVGL